MDSVRLPTFLTLWCGLCCVCGVLANVPFSYSDCTRSEETRIGRILRANIVEPHIQIGDNLTPYVRVRILRPLLGDYQLNVTIAKSVFGYYLNIPCSRCSFNLCQLLDRFFYRHGEERCPWQLTASDFPCTCPISPGHYTLRRNPFFVHPVRSSLSFSGDYNVRLVLTDLLTNQEAACYEMAFTIKDVCTTLLCRLMQYVA